MEKTRLDSEIQKLENENLDLEEQKQALYKENKVPTDDRSKAQKMSSMFTLLIICCSIAIGISSFNDSAIKYMIIAIAAIAICIIIVAKCKINKRIKAISLQLTEYDKKVSELDQQISSNKATITRNNEKISNILMEEKYKSFLKNHICIYVGFSSELWKKEPAEIPYKLVRSATIYVDGMEIGAEEAPFTAYEVNPGTHIVKIEAVEYLDRDIRRDVESKAIQVKIEDDSKFILFHWSIYKNPNGNGFVDSLSVKEFSNIYEFMKASNQK